MLMWKRPQKHHRAKERIFPFFCATGIQNRFSERGDIWKKGTGIGAVSIMLNLIPLLLQNRTNLPLIKIHHFEGQMSKFHLALTFLIFNRFQ